MAQKTGKKEETEFKVAETITAIVPCINNCGLTATAANNMCQNCFSAAAAASATSVAGISPHPPRSARSAKRPFPDEEDPSASAAREDHLRRRDEAAPSEAKRVVNRCSGCRRRVGLTGFRCRCGELFCAEHRYSDRHDCSFDYKAAGREAIARENPVIRAAKIVKV